MQSGPNDLGAGIGPIAAGQGTVWIANTDQPLLYRMDGSDSRPDRTTLEGPRRIDGDRRHRRGDLARPQRRSADPCRIGDRVDHVRSRSAARTSALAAGPSTSGSRTHSAAVAERWIPRPVRSTRRIKVGGRPAGVAIAPDGSVWVTIQAP